MKTRKFPPKSFKSFFVLSIFTTTTQRFLLRSFSTCCCYTYENSSHFSPITHVLFVAEKRGKRWKVSREEFLNSRNISWWVGLNSRLAFANVRNFLNFFFVLTRKKNSKCFSSCYSDYISFWIMMSKYTMCVGNIFFQLWDFIINFQWLRVRCTVAIESYEWMRYQIIHRWRCSRCRVITTSSTVSQSQSLQFFFTFVQTRKKFNMK